MPVRRRAQARVLVAPALLALAAACAAPPPEGQAAGTCADGVDNDGDGATDCADDGCAGAAECDPAPDDDDGGDDDSAADDDDATPEHELECEQATSVRDMPLVRVCAGSFTMGCSTPPGCRGYDLPPHPVTLTRDFLLGATEVTQAQWAAVMPGAPDPSLDTACGPDCPVERVNWFDAATFANALSESQGLPPCYELIGCTGDPGLDLNCTDFQVLAPEGDVYACEGYRLPTDAEWEYAARADDGTLYPGSDVLEDVGWVWSNSGGGKHPVATVVQPNGWGLWDMAGNVKEWAHDRQHEFARPAEAAVDPSGPPDWFQRWSVLRGSSYSSSDGTAWSSQRTSAPASIRSYAYGFRIAKTVAVPVNP